MIEASYLTQMKMVFEIVDARPEGRFLGRDPEPRPGVPSGHIPGSKSLPFKLLLNPDDTFKTNEEIKQVFE
jgi:thiosulfate/3-mercaptopyruvate sulfurtransferase